MQYKLLLVVTTIIWGSTFFVIKGAVENVNEYFLVFIRTALAAIFLFIFQFFKDKKSLTNKRTIKKSAVLGFLLAVVYISQTVGLKYTSSGHSAFITSSAILLVPFILFFFFKEKLNLYIFITIIIVAFGLFLLTYDVETKINVGDLITLITVVSAAVIIVMTGHYVKGENVAVLTAYQFLFAAIFSLIAYFFVGDFSFNFTNGNIYAILYLGFIGTLVCYFIMTYAQKYVDAFNASLIFSLEPIFASIFAFFAVSEKLNFKELTGASLIISGIFFYQIISRRKKVRKIV